MVAGEVSAAQRRHLPRLLTSAPQFVDVYSKAQEGAAWDAVATVYFVDTVRVQQRKASFLADHYSCRRATWCAISRC
jgi:hypothetical protein